MSEGPENIQRQESRAESELSRRALLRGLGSAAALPAAAGAQHAHHATQSEEKAPRKPSAPKYFNAQEFRTLAKLAELIIPADENSPGAAAGGAAEYIDLLASKNGELAAIFTGGLAWLDRESERRHGTKFADGKPEQQAALLDLIAYRKNDSPELGPGIRFFHWARMLTVDAYYTSKAGIADLGYKGNVGMTEFKVPEEAVKLALERSGLG